MKPKQVCLLQSAEITPGDALQCCLSSFPCFVRMAQDEDVSCPAAESSGLTFGPPTKRVARMLAPRPKKPKALELTAQ